ncbi:MAG: hypothetical protein IPG39_04750 [Bacteroidetes bacterium]|nr:hypothetical protein [Bacteroidota bacterium]
MKNINYIVIYFISTLSDMGRNNHQWLLGSYNFFQDPKVGCCLIQETIHINENGKMVFKGTQANISDAGSNLLMSSNGIWIASATGDPC